MRLLLLSMLLFLAACDNSVDTNASHTNEKALAEGTAFALSQEGIEHPTPAQTARARRWAASELSSSPSTVSTAGEEVSLLIAFGQSNCSAGGSFQVPAPYAAIDTTILYFARWPQTWRRLSDRGAWYGPNLTLLREMAGASDWEEAVIGLGGDLAVFKYCWGSTRLWCDWNPVQVCGKDVYRKFMAAFVKAIDDLILEGYIDINISAFMWTQGEGDASATYGPLYGTNLAAFETAVEADVGAVLGQDVSATPWIINKVYPLETFQPWSDVVRAQEQSFCDSHPLAVCVETDDLENDGGWHITPEGVLEEGDRAWTQYKALWGF